ncbi:hypothetical protein HDU67_002276, partial [Dinochytrium kinnereticum]
MPPLPLPSSIRDPSTLLIKLSKTLLDAIVSGDWETYSSLTTPTITCFEPEAGTHLVQGLPFHKHYFDLSHRSASSSSSSKTLLEPTTTLASPKVTILAADGSAALVTYVRLTQRVDAEGRPFTTETSETRVWVRDSEDWEK